MIRTVTPEICVGESGNENPSQPHADEGPVVLFDGDIFDEEGLIANPEQLIAGCYARGELDRLAWLNGSFSSIIIDRQSKRVSLATDRIGSRCLFAWFGEGGMSAASQLSALLADNRIPQHVSLQGLIELLSFQRTMAAQTQYVDIEVLPGAAVWTFQDGVVEKRNTRPLIWTGAARNKGKTAEQLADALRAAAKRRLSDLHRPGLLLSGGLDARTVLAAASANGDTLDCISVIARDNQETKMARAIAEAAGADFRLQIADPAVLSSAFDASVEASHGIFAAPINLFGSLEPLAERHDALFSGHGLDYTLRGYYLPCRRMTIAGGQMRLPVLSPVDTATPDAIANGQRVGIAADLAKNMLRSEYAAEWEARRAVAVAAAMDGATFAAPHDAWDSLILHAQGRHYANSDFVAMERKVPHRTLAFDSDVLDIYFSMPASWRADEWVARKALQILSTELADIPDANTGFRASIAFPAQLAMMLSRAVMRRVGLVARAPSGDGVETDRSWADLAELMRRDQYMCSRVEKLPDSEILLDTKFFDRKAMRDVVTAHMERRADNRKLLHQLLSIESWFTRHPYGQVGNG
jgi:asparagine synthetase B (glutamine-hydrolysing)